MRGVNWIRLVERVIIVCAVIFVGVLHVLLFLHAGALWRDEANSAAFAAMPSVSSIASLLGCDHFPIGSSLILRVWSSVSSSDRGLRLFGLLVGIGIIAALWLTSRMFGFGAPLIGIALVGLNSTAIVYGDAVRPYGVGALVIVAVAGLVWRMTRSNSPYILAAAIVSAVLSVQCLYQNSIFVFAICTTGAVVALGHRDWRATVSILGVGAISAISLVPYIGAIRQNRDWGVVWQSSTDLGELWGVVLEALGGSWTFSAGAWIGLVALGIPLAVWHLFGRARARNVQQEILLFSIITLTLSAAGFLAFIKDLAVPSQPWYYLQLIAIGAVCLDGIFVVLSTRWAIQVVRLAMIPVVIGTAGLSLWDAVHVRATNVDVIASQLRSKASPEDFVVVNPWHIGVSFRRAYHGPGSWMTVPPIEDLRIHRYDLLKQEMASESPLEPLLAGMQRSLSSGKRVWVIGGLIYPADGQTVSALPPAPHGPAGWNSADYLYVWTLQVGQFLKMHALWGEQVDLPVDGAVSRFENEPLLLFEGWRP